MTIEEIEDILPSGFHDASLNALSIDYVKREARFELFVDIGDPDSPEEILREATKPGRLTVTGLLYCIVEPPKPDYPCQETGGLWINSGAIKSSDCKLSAELPMPLPQGAFAHSFFVNDWNASIIVAATDARFEWDER
jgi:hypothetical protein